MKKYIKPSIAIVEIGTFNLMVISTEVGIGYGGIDYGVNIPGSRGRHSDWEDEDDWDDE